MISSILFILFTPSDPAPEPTQATNVARLALAIDTVAHDSTLMMFIIECD